MKLYPLEPTSRLARNILNISKRLGFEVISYGRLNGLIIISDGTPDDYVMSILSYRLNGEEVPGIVKPVKKRFEVFEAIPTYLKYQLNRLIVLIDQEGDSLPFIFNEVKRRLREGGMDVQSSAEEGRLGVYGCKRGISKFELIVIVNGLDEYPFSRHTIEDHLLKAASALLGEDISGFTDPKDGWRGLKDKQYKVFERLMEAEKIEEIFPQHMRGLKRLDRGNSQLTSLSF